MNLNHQLNEKLLESTDGFHEDQQQLQVKQIQKLKTVDDNTIQNMNIVALGSVFESNWTFYTLRAEVSLLHGVANC